jgi:hypothetical protein
MIFDRSWYNRAGVELVLGFCTKEQRRRFLEPCPAFEKVIVKNGIQLIKYWLELGHEQQGRRFEARIEDPLRQWKLSPRISSPVASGSPIREPATSCWKPRTPNGRRGRSSDPILSAGRA